MPVDLRIEIGKTAPDFVLYAPRDLYGSSGDTGNEHCMVFAWGGGLRALWTQSTFEGESDQRVVFASSEDGGRTWSPPRVLAGPGAGRGMASWGCAGAGGGMKAWATDAVPEAAARNGRGRET